MNISRILPLVIVSLVVGFGLPSTTLAATGGASTTAELTMQIKMLQTQLMLLSAGKGVSVTIAPLEKKTSFDQRYYTSRSNYPSITGKANIDSVYIILKNAQGVGFVGTRVPVVNGRWSYESLISLTPGYYTVELSGGDKIQTRNVHILDI
ncbi:MAG: hypothetical protein KA104_01870 [Candidatus Pacebacteria bacterium]|nr:hypothetical protein [Candidatus Paceibacterota bacterium]